MGTPSAEDMEKLYPLEDWCRDLDFWSSRGALSTADFARVAAYFQRVHAADPQRDANCGQLWAALAFLQSFLPELIRGGAAKVAPSGEALPSPGLVTALYRAFMSPVASANPLGITVPLILEVVRDQKDWNEDRS
jgi:hypothetical protein